MSRNVKKTQCNIKRQKQRESNAKNRTLVLLFWRGRAAPSPHCPPSRACHKNCTLFLHLSWDYILKVCFSATVNNTRLKSAANSFKQIVWKLRGLSLRICKVTTRTHKQKNNIRELWMNIKEQNKQQQGAKILKVLFQSAANTNHMTSSTCKMLQTCCSNNERFKLKHSRISVQLGSKMVQQPCERKIFQRNFAANKCK